MAPMQSNRGLWLGAGTLFVVLFTFKQSMWNIVGKQVKTIREEDHAKAVASLQRAHQASKPFALAELTDSQRNKIKKALTNDSTSTK